MTDLNTLACAGSSLNLTCANDINSLGEIVGYAVDPSTHIHYGFYATPAHEACGAGTSANDANGPLPETVLRSVSMFEALSMARTVTSQ